MVNSIDDVPERDTELLTVSEAAAILRLHPNSVRKLGQSGILAEQRVGRRRDRRYIRRQVEQHAVVRGVLAAALEGTKAGVQEARDAAERDNERVPDNETRNTRCADVAADRFVAAKELTVRLMQEATAGDAAIHASEQHRQLMERMASGGAALASEQQRQAIERMASGGAALQASEQQRQAIERMASGGAALQAIERQRELMERMASGGAALQASEQQHQLMERMASGGAALQASEQQRELMERMAPGCAVLQAGEDNRRLVEQLAAPTGRDRAELLSLQSSAMQAASLQSQSQTTILERLQAQISADQRRYAEQLNLALRAVPISLADRIVGGVSARNHAAEFVADSLRYASTIGRSTAQLEASRAALAVHDETSRAMLARIVEEQRPAALTRALSAFRVAGTMVEDAVSPLKAYRHVDLSSHDWPQLAQPTVFREFQKEQERLSANEDVLSNGDIEDEVEQSEFVQHVRLTRRLNDSRHSVDRRAQLLTGSPVFKATADTVFIAGRIATHLVSNESGFATLAMDLFKFIYEASGDGARITELIPDFHPSLRAIKFTRRLYAHDLEHGGQLDYQRKYRDVGDIFRELIGTPTPSSQSDWRGAATALLRLVEDLLIELNRALAKLGSDADRR